MWNFRLLLPLFFACSLAAQNCQAPALAPSREPNIFSEEQEVWLGDVDAQRIRGTMRVIEDPSIAEPLQRIGDGLIKFLPPTNLRFRFFLVEGSEVNAMATAGGRIYVERKLVAFARNEDELAGVLAHEIGHIIARQIAITYTRLFRDVLDVKQVRDRADVDQKYQQLWESFARRPWAMEEASKHRDREQSAADEIGVYLAARAGYSPKALPDFLDRTIGLTGKKKGRWFNEFFGVTKEDAKRLRELANNVASIPASCVDKTEHSPEPFRKWHQSVAGYRGFGKTEAVPNLISKRKLAPLPSEVYHIKFSPDGKFLLAQDYGSIFLLTRDPLTAVFSIAAPKAEPAQFSPDSQSVVFYNAASLQVEKWSLAERAQEEVHHVHVPQGCWQTRLSPDGKVLACVQGARESVRLDLVLLEVASGDEITRKTIFERVGWFSWYFEEVDSQYRDLIAIAFSPDGRYLLAGHGGFGDIPDFDFGFDLSARTPVSLPGSTKKLMHHSFTFLGSNRIVGVNRFEPAKSAMVSFPMGEVLAPLRLGRTKLSGASAGDYLIVRPIREFPAAVVDVKTDQIAMASKTPAIDVYGDIIGTIRENGNVVLHRRGEPKPVATAMLPPAPLNPMHAAALSKDAKFLALSQRQRGVVWDLASGDQLFFVTGFRGVHFGDDNAIYADFPPAEEVLPGGGMDKRDKDRKEKEEDKPGHKIGRMDLASGKVAEHRSLDAKLKISQRGRLLTTITSSEKDGPLWKNATFQVQDVRTGETLWSKHFPKELPAIDGGRFAVFSWYLDPDLMKGQTLAGPGGANEEVKTDPELRKRVNAIKDLRGYYLIEVVDLQSGQPLGKFPLDTGQNSFRIRAMVSNGKQIYVWDNQDRILVYSLTGERKATFFGTNVSYSDDGKLLCIQIEPGRLAIYDVASMQKLEQFTFPTSISAAWFMNNLGRLLVLTDDQTLYTIGIGQGGTQAETKTGGM
jgi:WD40 repeat protein